MKRLLLLVLSTTLLLALLPMHAADAKTRTGPSLSLAFGDDSSSITVSGRKCVPVGDAPTSVLVTADWLADKVFTATPDSLGKWSVDLPLPDPLDGSHTVNAECDDYYGTMTYPEAGFGVLAASGSAPVPRPPVITDPPPTVANTGTHGGQAAALGGLLLALGAGLLWLGRRRSVHGA